MVYKLRDFECKSCGNAFEELVKEGEVIECPQCNSTDLEQCISIPNLATMSLLPKEEYAAKMRKRSADHTRALVAKEGVGGRAAINLTRKS